MAVTRLDHKGMGEMLKSTEVALFVADSASDIAQTLVNDIGTEYPVVVDVYETDRAAASVTIAHPAGLALQAKRGVLTRAASAHGVEVHSKLAK